MRVSFPPQLSSGLSVCPALPVSVSTTVYFDSPPTWVTLPDQVPAISGLGTDGRAAGGGFVPGSAAGGFCCAARGGIWGTGAGASCGHLRPKSSCCAPAAMIGAATAAIKAAAQFRNALFMAHLPVRFPQHETYARPEKRPSL